MQFQLPMQLASGLLKIFLPLIALASSLSEASPGSTCRELFQALKSAQFEEVRYGGKVFKIPVVSEFGVSISPRRKTINNSDRNAEVVKSLNTIWNLAEFEKPRAPLKIGEVKNKDYFDNPTKSPRILDMPIKFPGSDYRIPEELAPFAKTIQEIIDYEHSINPKASELYAYITIDHSIVKEGETQRHGGAHVDGFQGARISPKLPIDHSYVASNKTPTRFFNQPFKVDHLDEARDDFFLEFDRQKKETAIVEPAPYDIVLMDAYAVHEAAMTTKPGPRTFLRLSYTIREFDRLGNTHNPMFNYKWEMLPRDVHSTLSKRDDIDTTREIWKNPDVAIQVDEAFRQQYVIPQESGHRDAFALFERLAAGESHATTLLKLGFRVKKLKSGKSILTPPSDVYTLFKLFDRQINEKAAHNDKQMNLALMYIHKDPDALLEQKYLFIRPGIDPDPDPSIWNLTFFHTKELPEIIYAKAVSEGKYPFIINTINHDQGHWTAFVEDDALVRATRGAHQRLFSGTSITEAKGKSFEDRHRILQEVFSSSGQTRAFHQRFHFAIEYLSIPDIKQSQTIRNLMPHQFSLSGPPNLSASVELLKAMPHDQFTLYINRLLEHGKSILYRGPGGQRDTYTVERTYTNEGSFNPGIDAHLRSLLSGQHGVTAADFRQVMLESPEGILRSIQRLHQILQTDSLASSFGPVKNVHQLLLEQIARLEVAFRTAIELNLSPATVVNDSTTENVSPHSPTRRFFSAFVRPGSYFANAYEINLR